MEIQPADIPEDIVQKFAKCGLLFTSAVTVSFYGLSQNGGARRLENLYIDEPTLIQLMYVVCPIHEGTPFMSRCWRYYVRTGAFRRIAQAERGEKEIALELLGMLI